jgi:hypothetical protein
MESQQRPQVEMIAEQRKAIAVLTKDLADEKALRRMQSHPARTSRARAAQDRALAAAIAERQAMRASASEGIRHA